MAGNLIRSAILMGASELMTAHGVRPGPVARAAGLPTRALSDPHLLVPTIAVVRLFELAAEQCNLRTFSLQLARDAHLAPIIGPLWILLHNARTVEEMCREFADNFDLFSGSAMLALEPVEGGTYLSWSLTGGLGISEVQTSEFSLAHVVREIQSRTRPDWHPETVLFRHKRPAGGIRLHREIFGPDVRFNQDTNALFLSSASLELPLLRARGSTARALAGRFARLEEDTPSRSFVRNVEIVVRALMPYGPCTIKGVSEALDLAPRTLQKHLTLEKSSFLKIRDAVRADLASRYLRHSELSVTQIAEILGYGDPTCLSRSFRRWNGRSPREARKR